MRRSRRQNLTHRKRRTRLQQRRQKGSPSVTPVSEKSAYQDGTYTGTGTGFAGPITVQVIIKGGKIAEITVLSTSDDSPYIDNAKALLKNIVAVQSTNVDTGFRWLTYSSVGLISAVRDALQKAGGSSAIGFGTAHAGSHLLHSRTAPAKRRLWKRWRSRQRMRTACIPEALRALAGR